MNYIRHLRGFFDRLEKDEKITALHISLYMALFHFWNANRFRSQFEINRHDVMAMARIGSSNTYSRCMKELNDWGYIVYQSGGNRYRVGKVRCISFDTSSDTASDTANDTANDTTTDTGSDTASDTLFINYSNNKQDKRKPPRKFKNGKEKKYNSAGCYHVDNDKDYSEPL